MNDVLQKNKIADQIEVIYIKWISAKLPKEDYFILENKSFFQLTAYGTNGSSGANSCSSPSSGCGIPYGSP